MSFTQTQTDRRVLTGGVVVDAVELFRTGSGDELTCCTARPAGTDPVHRQLTEHTGAVTDGERLVQYRQHPR